MIKRTLYFENPAYLSLSNDQLIIKIPEVEKNLVPILKEEFIHSIPIEDIGVVVLDNRQITITQGTLNALAKNNSAVIICDNQRMPNGLLLPLEGNTLHGERYREQIGATRPLAKRLWQQTIKAKITNQKALLEEAMQEPLGNMRAWIKEVKSGDSTNIEARAAIFYWANLFPKELPFSRSREGEPPNNLLNYGYAILRSLIARALVASGLEPALGIHHKNRYNAFALADDIMEPYRPYVDKLVLEIVDSGLDFYTLNSDIKRQLLSIPVMDVSINGLTRPLMIATRVTAASLVKCYKREEEYISYPLLQYEPLQ